MASFARKVTFAYFWYVKSKKTCYSNTRKKLHSNLRRGAFLLTDWHYRYVSGLSLWRIQSSDGEKEHIKKTASIETVF